MCLNIRTYHSFSARWFACNKTGEQMIADDSKKHHDYNPYESKQILQAQAAPVSQQVCMVLHGEMPYKYSLFYFI